MTVPCRTVPLSPATQTSFRARPQIAMNASVEWTRLSRDHDRPSQCKIVPPSPAAQTSSAALPHSASDALPFGNGFSQHQPSSVQSPRGAGGGRLASAAGGGAAIAGAAAAGATARSAASLTITAATTSSTTTRTRRSPLRTARWAPTAAPAALAAAMGSATAQMTTPRLANRSIAATLDARLTTFALPEARVSASPNTTAKATTSIDPVPGPKKPS